MARNEDLASLINKLYGNNDLTQGYRGTVDQAYHNLDQPLTDPNTGREDKTTGLVSGLANSFADSVLKKTGKLPSEDQVRSFVAEHATTGNAQKFIQGTLNTDNFGNMADQYLQSKPEILSQLTPQTQQTDPQQRILGLNNQLDEAYKSGAQNYVDSYNQNVYNPAKQQTANDLAGQGMLTQPNSRYSLDQIESNRGRDISSGLNTLAGERAKGSVGLGTTIENLLQGQQQINNQNTQFNQNLGLQRQQFNANQDQNVFNQGLQKKQLDIAGQIGRLQAGGQDNNGLSGALGGATSGALAGNTIMPGWGTAIGGIAGGLGGYFGTKR